MTSNLVKLVASNKLASWQEILSDPVTDLHDLLDAVELSASQLPQIDFREKSLPFFPLKVPRPYLSRIEKGNPDDPLLKQILPINKEVDNTFGYSNDPLSEQHFISRPGILHKYEGRALLIVAPHCAIHCRYCFRRHFPYADNSPSRSQWQQSLNYIENDPSIEEVIYSGGDPLAASDKQLAWLSTQISQISHVKRLRIHTRMPIMVPQRIDDSLLNWLDDSPLQCVMVIHCNHPNELDSEVAESLLRLHRIGITLLNQSVLLKGINDDVKTQSKLSKKLFSMNVLPYYLHLLDKVQGVAHFDVSEDQAKKLITGLRNSLSGYLVPRLVREIAGQRSKTPLL